MDKLDKTHKIGVAYNLIKTVMEDTDEDLWAYKYLGDALADLDFYFEEYDFQGVRGMDIICKPKYNVVFWRESADEDWHYENLDTVVESYTDIPQTELDYVAPVRRENTGEILYHIFKCRECDKTVLTVDANHEYEFCPHCGRAIWRQEMKELECPAEDCKDCEFNRYQSWCARALPDYKGHTELEKIRMEGFWEAINWCEEHYKWMEDHWEKLDDYTGLVIKILEECYADRRAPTAEEITKVDNFWNGED